LQKTQPETFEQCCLKRDFKDFSGYPAVAARLYRLNALGSFAFLTPLEPWASRWGSSRKINKFAPQAAFFKGFAPNIFTLLG